MEDFRLKVLNFKVGRYQQYIYIFTYLARYLQKWGIPIFSLWSSTDVLGQESPESDCIISHHEQIAFWGHINNTARCEEFISNEIAEIFPLHQVGQLVQPLSD